MMSIVKFARINGHTPTITRDLGMYSAKCECNCGEYLVILRTEPLRSVTLALERLLAMVLTEHSLIVMGNQGWKCLLCGRVAPLESDHIISRAQGRDDRVINLRGLCNADHRARHRENIRPADTART